MRIPLLASLAWQDYRNDGWLSACSVLALVAVIAPLLVLFGLKFGLVSSLTERLENDPATREIIPLGGGGGSVAPLSSNLASAAMWRLPSRARGRLRPRPRWAR